MPRHQEHLGLVDKGVILYRQLLNGDNMAKVERGEDPMGTIRDPAQKRADPHPHRGRPRWQLARLHLAPPLEGPIAIPTS